MTQTIPLANAKAIAINKDDLVAIARKQAAIEVQQEILDALRAALERLIEEKYSIDLADNWVLDLDRGVLEQEG